MDESLVSLLGESGTPDQSVDAYADLNDIFQAPAAKTESAPVEKAPEEPAPQQEQKPPEVAKEHDGFKKRIDKLTAKAKQAESERDLSQRELQELKAAFEMLKEEHQAKVRRLEEIDVIDPRDAELQRLKFERTVEQKQKELELQWQKREAEVRQAARVEAAKERLQEQLETAASSFPSVSKHELILALRDSPDTDPVDLAKRIHDQRLSVYENLLKDKFRQSAPQPLTQKSVARPAASRSTKVSDIVAELDAELGADWYRK